MKEILAIDSDFPDRLKQFPPIPRSINYAGNINLINKDFIYVAIIGTRAPSEYGLEMAYKFSYLLAKNGIVVISGLARGIDTQAHKAALDAGGKTIAVLGSGLDVIYPPENSNLFKKIIKNNLIITEYSNGTKPLGRNFLKRNRLIAGLSDVILVIEGKKRSGTLNTVRYAAEMGKDVYALPGRIDSKLSEAPNLLIENGAGIALSPDSFLDSILRN